MFAVATVSPYSSNFGLRRLFCGAIVALIAGAGTSLADWVTMADGRREQCIILDETPHTLRIQHSGGELTIQRKTIASVERASPAENMLLRAEYAQVGGESLSGLISLYEKALELGAPGSQVAWSLTPALRDLLERREPLSRGEEEELTRMLRSFAGPLSDGAPAEFLFSSASLLARRGAMEHATRLFQKIPPDRLDLNPRQRADFTDLVVGDIRRLLDEGDLEEAVTRLETLHGLDAERARSCEALIHLHSAGQLRGKGEFAAALSLYETRVFPEFPEIARDRARVALEESIEEARDDDGYREAIALLEGPGARFPGVEASKPLLASAWRLWGDDLLDRGEFDAARQAYARSMHENPEEGEVRLNRVEYRERREAISPEAPEERYALARFCVEAELFDEAAREFQKVREHPDWRELADSQLRDLEWLRYEGMLFDALEMKNAGRYPQALEKAGYVLAHAVDESLRDDARRVADLIEKSAQLEKARAPAEAEVLWQNAQRCILPDQSEEFLELLARIIREYPQTPAAVQALEYRRFIVSRGLAQLETVRGRDVAGVQWTPPRTPPVAATGPIEADRLREETRRIQKALETPRVP